MGMEVAEKTKQEKIQEGIKQILIASDEDEYKSCRDEAKEILKYLDSQGVVIKVDKELPIPDWEGWLTEDYTQKNWHKLAQTQMLKVGYVAVDSLLKGVENDIGKEIKPTPAKCPECDGKGFKEYDAGLLQIGCRTCSGIGKVDCELTKDEFERAYAFRSVMTPGQVLELGLVAMPGDCVEGWVMEKSPIPEADDAPTDLVAVFKDGSVGKILVGKVVEVQVSEDRLDVVAELTTEGKEKLEEIGIIVRDEDVSDSGNQPANQPTGSRNTGKSSKPKQSKAKAKARK